MKATFPPFASLTVFFVSAVMHAAAESESFTTRKNLTEGWFGLAEPLAARGVSFDLSTTHYYAGLLSGIGYYYYNLSDQLQSSLAGALPINDEQGVEIFYNLALTGWLRVTADLQWINPARRDFSDAWVAGIRTSINF